eukprot:jgi/Mesvir1/5952/Mv00711-RA.1
MFPFAAIPLSGARQYRKDHAARDAVDRCGRESRIKEADAEENKCRICWETEGPLCRPCACSGSIAHVHEACLHEWQRRQFPNESAFICSVCRSSYSECPFERAIPVCGFPSQRRAFLLKAAAVVLLLLAGKAGLKLLLTLAFPLQFLSFFLFLGFLLSTLPLTTQLRCLSLILKGMLGLHRAALALLVLVNGRVRQMITLARVPHEMRAPLLYLLDCSDKVNDFSRGFILEVEQNVGMVVDRLIR